MKHPEEARQFYESLPQPVLVGTEACGFTLWFEELLMELGDELRIGAADRRCGMDRRRRYGSRRPTYATPNTC